MEKSIIEKLRKQYPSAPYVYFRITNYKQARDSFLSGKVDSPVFTYFNTPSHEILNDRFEQLVQVETLNSSLANEFINRRKAETKLLLDLNLLHKNPSDKSALKSYRSIVEMLYGSFDINLVFGVLNWLKFKAEENNKVEYFTKLKALLNTDLQVNDLYKPTEETFNHYSNLLKQSDHAVLKLVEKQLDEDFKEPEKIRQLFIWALNEIDALDQGWTAVLSKGGSNVLISRHNKKIMIGKDFSPNTVIRAKQLVAHEVFVHVRRVVLHNSISSPVDEEGVGIIMEQLIVKSFHYKRLMRYLAAALAWGFDGRPRDFKETYEALLLGFKLVINPSNEQLAKERAFAETVRIFRGGVPSVAGAAYIKDKIYFESNLKIWSKLEGKKLTSEQFINMIDGYKV
jgi:hypothetical protein